MSNSLSDDHKKGKREAECLYMAEQMLQGELKPRLRAAVIAGSHALHHSGWHRDGYVHAMVAAVVACEQERS